MFLSFLASSGQDPNTTFRFHQPVEITAGPHAGRRGVVTLTPKPPEFAWESQMWLWNGEKLVPHGPGLYGVEIPDVPHDPAARGWLFRASELKAR